MQDARYLRDQAALCLEIARQVSDRQLSDTLRHDAAQYYERATQLELRQLSRFAESAASSPRNEEAGKH